MKDNFEYKEPLSTTLHDWEGLTRLFRDQASLMKKAEYFSRTSEERYRIYFSQVNEIMFSLDRQLVCRFVSPNVERVIGYLPEELIGKSFVDTKLVHPEDIQEAIENAQSAFTGGILRSAVLRLITRDGVCILAEMSAFRIERNGQTEEVVYMARDISGRVPDLPK